MSQMEQAEIVRRILSGPRPFYHALWIRDGKLYERVGLQGKPDHLPWQDAARRVGMQLEAAD